MRRSAILLTLAVLLAAAPALAGISVWTDAQGHRVYSNRATRPGARTIPEVRFDPAAHQARLARQAALRESLDREYAAEVRRAIELRRASRPPVVIIDRVLEVPVAYTATPRGQIVATPIDRAAATWLGWQKYGRFYNLPSPR